MVPPLWCSPKSTGGRRDHGSSREGAHPAGDRCPDCARGGTTGPRVFGALSPAGRVRRTGSGDPRCGKARSALTAAGGVRHEGWKSPAPRYARPKARRQWTTVRGQERERRARAGHSGGGRAVPALDSAIASAVLSAPRTATRPREELSQRPDPRSAIDPDRASRLARGPRPRGQQAVVPTNGWGPLTPDLRPRPHRHRQEPVPLGFSAGPWRPRGDRRQNRRAGQRRDTRVPVYPYPCIGTDKFRPSAGEDGTDAR